LVKRPTEVERPILLLEQRRFPAVGLGRAAQS